MPDASAALGPLKAACEAIVKGGRQIFRWAWDDRFDAALSPFPVEESATAHALLEQHLATCWTTDTIGQAGPDVRRVTASFGDLREGQELFLTDPGRPLTLVACWWPWGNGDTISLRLKLLARDASQPDEGMLRGEFRSWFGV